MDLSKAFDCLPHHLIVKKLHSYNIDINAVNLLYDYLSDRKQCVQLGSAYKSDFVILEKGVPQGSVLVPLQLNIFLNDIF